jgi:mRNA-degrading endonuclease RelE of RelBE toxin-antitoxin system
MGGCTMTITETLSAEEIKCVEAGLNSIKTGKVAFWPVSIDDLARFLYEPDEPSHQNIPETTIKGHDNAVDQELRPSGELEYYGREVDEPIVYVNKSDVYECHDFAKFEPLSQLPSDHPARNVFLRAKWLIGMTDDFVKSTEGLDRKMKGSVLEAIGHISEQPITQRGDTVKPLNSNLKGLWRYRIGDFRLLYKPDVKNKTVFLILFAKRSEAYQ